MYTAAGVSTSSTGPKTAIQVASTTVIRPMVNEMVIGSSTTPADVVMTVNLVKVSALGTGGAGVTPTPLDSGDVPCISIGMQTCTSEPTTAFTMMTIPLNQRATFRWVAQDGREIIPAAGAATGVCTIMTLAGSAAVLNATMMFRE